LEKNILIINGREVEFTGDMTVLEAAQSAGIYIPTLCHHPDLKPTGDCRLCVVEIDGTNGVVTACTTPAANGMVVTTESPAIDAERQTALEPILSMHPTECLGCHRRERCSPFDICLRNVIVADGCVVCPSNGNCELQRVVDYIGIHNLHFDKYSGTLPVDISHPFFNLDQNRCILCKRCLRTCSEITGIKAIELASPGEKKKVVTLRDADPLESLCRSCGECVVRCPVGALTFKEISFPEYEVHTTCPYCAVGCQMYLGVRDGRIISVRGNPEGRSNEGRLCVKGRFGISGFVHHEDRLKTPLIKRDGKFEKASWEEALSLVADKLKSYNKEEIGVVSSARSTNEANYIAQKFTRAVIGTNNVDHCARL